MRLSTDLEALDEAARTVARLADELGRARGARDGLLLTLAAAGDTPRAELARVCGVSVSYVRRLAAGGAQ
jgi:hypothetical protein